MGLGKDNISLVKSMDFAVRIVNLHKYLTSAKNEYTMSKQLLKSGTSIGANLREAVEGVSRKDFEAKIYISLKEARETDYWLELLYRTEYLSKDEYDSIVNDCTELRKILSAITKTLRKKGR